MREESGANYANRNRLTVLCAETDNAIRRIIENALIRTQHKFPPINCAFWFDNSQARHNKKYSDAGEEKMRYKIYLENRHKIAKHNTRYHSKDVTYRLDLNKYADMLHTEFVRTLNGYNRTRDHENSVYGGLFARVEEPVTFIGAANVQLPGSLDWRDKGAVTPIKDQGHCGRFRNQFNE